jgi:predicted PurR-regulated permease PerM
VLTAFLLGSGPGWVQSFLALQPRGRAERLAKVLRDMAGAVSGYVAGALTISFIDGAFSFIVLTILNVPFAAPLAVLMGVMSLIPLVGATIGAVLVGVVTAFSDFPTDTILWTIWAVIYQQFENNVIQPQVQRRTLQVHPFIVLVSVLFGSTLLGILGALVAVPAAASIQILLRDWWEWRRSEEEAGGLPAPAPDS